MGTLSQLLFDLQVAVYGWRDATPHCHCWLTALANFSLTFP
jgi:hypothetical protein